MIRPYQQTQLLLILILLAGFALRLYGLGVESLWYDETVSAILAQQSIPALIAHTARDIHPPGYYILLNLWSRWVGGSEFALAYLSVIFGTLLIGAGYRVGRRWFKQSVGLWAAGLIAFSSYNLWYSQEVRMYTVGAFLGIACIHFGLQAANFGALDYKPKLSLLLGYTLCATFGLYCLYYFAFLLIPLNLYLMTALWRSPVRNEQIPLTLKRKSQLYPWVLANFAIIALYLPWLSTAWHQATNPPVPPWRSYTPILETLVESWKALSFGESTLVSQIWPLLLVTLILFGLGMAVIRSMRWRIFLLGLAFGPLALIYLIPLTGLTTGPLYHVRYLFTYSPIFYVVIAVACAWLSNRQRWVAWLVGILLVGGNAFSIIEFHTNPQYTSDDLRGAVALIQQKWRPGDLILANAGYAYTAIQYYYDGPIQDFQRLTNFDSQTTVAFNRDQPFVLQTGTIDGPASLGWNDPASDFYASSQAETIAALNVVNRTFARIWVLRIYDTVTDSEGVIRQWFSDNMLMFEDQVFSGESNLRVQGYLQPHQRLPDNAQTVHLTQGFVLHGYALPEQQYQPGDTIDVALWLSLLAPTEVPYALSLKMWDDTGNLVAQTEPDEWPVGNRYLTLNWVPDHIIRYPMRLKIPTTVAPQQYWLNAVIYNSSNGQPVQVQETGETVILLGGINITLPP